MNKIVEYKQEHALNIIERNRRDFGRVVPPELVKSMVEAYEIPGSMAFTMMSDGIPVCCGGVMNMGWNRGEAWLLISKLHAKHKLAAYKEIGAHIVKIVKQMGLKRVQAICLRDDMDTWFRYIGFVREGRLRSYGPNGEDVIMYSRIFGET